MKKSVIEKWGIGDSQHCAYKASIKEKIAKGEPVDRYDLNWRISGYQYRAWVEDIKKKILDEQFRKLR